MPAKIVFLAYPGFDLLDVTGPASVFAEAGVVLGTPAYEVIVASPQGGPVLSNAGIALHSEALTSRRTAGAHTLLVSGAKAQALGELMACEPACRWLTRRAATATRFGSVCSGAFVLAALGLLDGRRVATHWSVCELLSRRYPALSVDGDALYVNDGVLWTSAGVTSGIDMALAMVEADHGAGCASAIARHLVLYARRPGYQSQFSALLNEQGKADAPFAELVAWMHTHLRADLGVPALAARMALSERTFYRRFSDATHQTPAQFVESLRLDAARSLMPGGLSLKAIASKVGLQSASRLSAAFTRRFGIAPALFRRMHAGA
jgi:transcriptional regulator GlxA family with amidase domain